MNRRDFIKLGSCCLLGGTVRSRVRNPAWAHQADNYIVEPEESDQVLVNPGMGFETFHSFNGDERNILAENYPELKASQYFYIVDIPSVMLSIS